MPRSGGGVYSKPAGTTAVTNTPIESAKYNSVVNDLVTDANIPRPIVAGGTGASSAAGALTALGLTATAAEINVLDGVTASTAELNILDGATVTTAELNVLDGIPGTLTATEVGYLDGVTSAIQTQLNAKVAVLADPGADRIRFWDDSAGAEAYLTPGTGLTITGTTIDAAAWTYETPVATTSGTTVTISTTIPAGVQEIEVLFDGVSLSLTDAVEVHLGTGGSFVTTGYVATGIGVSGDVNSTSGFPMRSNTAARALTGKMALTLFDPAGHKWIADHSMRSAADNGSFGGGSITLAGAVDRIRLAILGAGGSAFDAGNVNIRYR